MDGATHLLLPAAGLVLGLAFGAVVQRSDWCTMGAIADIRLMGDWRRMRSWLLAMATAILGTQALLYGGAVDIAGTSYLAAEIRFLPAILGGLAFGYGMTRTGGCISKNLVRLGGGSIRALVVLLVVAATALATMAGPLAWLQTFLGDVGTLDPGRRFPRQDLPALLGVVETIGAALALLIATGLAWFCLRERRFRASRPLLVAGPVLGVLIPLGWLATARLGPGPPVSLDYVTASAGSLRAIFGGGAGAVFGVALLVGTVFGSLLAAWPNGRLRIEGFVDGRDLRRHLAGAAMMGVGGALAGGCTVGQGLTGVSTLGLTSILAVGSIVLGAVAGVRTLEADGVLGVLRALRTGQRA